MVEVTNAMPSATDRNCNWQLSNTAVEITVYALEDMKCHFQQKHMKTFRKGQILEMGCIRYFKETEHSIRNQGPIRTSTDKGLQGPYMLNNQTGTHRWYGVELP